MSDLEQKQNNTESTDLSTEGVDVLTGVREENEFDGTPSLTEEEKTELLNTAETTPITKPIIPPQETLKTKEIDKVAIPVQVKETTPEEIQPKNNPDTKAIRTFRLDTAQAIQGQKTSMVKMVIAEQQKKTERGEVPTETSTNKKPIIFVLLGISLVLIISVAVYVYFPQTSQDGKSAITPKQSSILTSTKTIDISAQKDSTLFDEIAQRTPTLTGTVESITAFRLIDPETKKVIPVEDVIAESTLSAPDIFIRSLAPEYLFGVYFKEGNTPFAVLKNTFFQNAFAGMLAWENTLEEDWRPIINSEHPGPKILEKTFSDALIQNKQVRILKDTTGKELLLYTFTDQNTLLITTNREALEALIAKLTVVKVVR